MIEKLQSSKLKRVNLGFWIFKFTDFAPISGVWYSDISYLIFGSFIFCFFINPMSKNER